MRQRIAARTVLFVVLATSCQLDLSRTLGPGDIRGTAERQLTGGTKEGLPNARARLIGTPYAARSDANGRFVLRNVPSGTHRLVLAYDGDADGAEEVQLRFPAFDLIALGGGTNPRGARDLGRVLMEPAGSIKGRVSQGGNPVSGGAVFIKEAPGVTANTSPDGTFRFPFVAKGTYNLGVVLPGSGAGAADLGAAVTLAPGEALDVGERTPGTPVPSVLVKGSIAFDNLLSSEDPTFLSLKLVGSGGRFPVVVAADGSYEVEVPSGFYALHLMPEGAVVDAWLPGVVAAPGVELPPLYVFDGSQVFDVDGDGLVGEQDPDQDGDGTNDKEEAPACVLDVDATTDLDNDNLCDSVDVDRDGDGFDDAFDNCPKQANSSQSDADNDGVGDPCDNCPSTPNRDQLDTDHNGRGDVCEGDPCAVGNGGCDPTASCEVVEAAITCSCPAESYGPGTWCQPRGARVVDLSPQPRDDAAYFSLPGLGELFMLGGGGRTDLWAWTTANGWQAIHQDLLPLSPEALRVAVSGNDAWVATLSSNETGEKFIRIFRWDRTANALVESTGLGIAGSNQLLGSMASDWFSNSVHLLATDDGAGKRYLALLNTFNGRLMKAEITATEPVWLPMTVLPGAFGLSGRTGAAAGVTSEGTFFVHGGNATEAIVWDLQFLVPQTTPGQYAWTTPATITGLESTEARADFAFTFDKTSGQLFVHGGRDQTFGNPVTAYRLTIGANATASLFVPTNTGGPSGTRHGLAVAGPGPALVVVDDRSQVNVLPNNGAWSALTDPVPPFPVVGEARFEVVPDAKQGHDALFVMGGFLGQNLSDASYRMAVGADAWSQPTFTENFTARTGLASAVDAEAGAIYLFGGNTSDGASNEVFTHVSGGANRWARVVVPDPSPSRRAGSLMAFDSVSKSLIVWGGDSVAAPINETPWLLTPGASAPAWSSARGPTLTHSSEFGVWDQAGRRLWLVPTTLPPATVQATGIVSWSLADPGFTDAAPSAGGGPQELADYRVVWDGANRRLLFLGGYEPSLERESTVVWAFAPDTGVWKTLCPDGGLPTLGGAGGFYAATTGDTLYVLRRNPAQTWAVELDMPECQGG